MAARYGQTCTDALSEILTSYFLRSTFIFAIARNSLILNKTHYGWHAPCIKEDKSPQTTLGYPRKKINQQIYLELK
jgi:hypothetical protein